jgi:hypothetical protein
MGEQQCKIFETATTGKADPLIPAERVLMPYSVSRNLRLAECPLLGVVTSHVQTQEIKVGMGRIKWNFRVVYN